MTINVIFKIAAMGILVTILGEILKRSNREDHAFLLTLAGYILALSWLVPYLSDLYETIRNLFEF